MAWLKHPTKSFNFNVPGEPFEVPDEDVGYLCSEHGCEVVDPDVPPLDLSVGLEIDFDDEAAVRGIRELQSKLPEPEPEPEPETEEPDDSIPDPIHVGGGWYDYNGERCRKRDLPPEALEALDG